MSEAARLDDEGYYLPSHWEAEAPSHMEVSGYGDRTFLSAQDLAALEQDEKRRAKRRKKHPFGFGPSSK